MTKIILVRHGFSTANKEGVFAGHLDVGLTEQGHLQAEKAAEFIFKNYKVDVVFSSDLKRAFSTAGHIAEKFNLSVIPNKNLREVYAGDWDGVKFDDIDMLYKKEYAIWKNDIGNSCCTNGESVKELSLRIVEEIKKIAEDNPEKTVVIATHATPIRVFECFLKGCSLDEMKNIPWVTNASVTIVNYENGKFEQEIIGEDSYLSELKTALPVNV